MGAGGRGSRIVAHMGGLGDTGEELWGSNTGLAVAAGTVSVPFSGLGRPSLGRYSHDRAYASLQQGGFKAHFATVRRKLPSFGLWISSGIFAWMIVHGRGCLMAGPSAEAPYIHWEASRQVGGLACWRFLTLSLLFPPYPSQLF